MRHAQSVAADSIPPFLFDASSGGWVSSLPWSAIAVMPANTVTSDPGDRQTSKATFVGRATTVKGVMVASDRVRVATGIEWPVTSPVDLQEG